ncbi:hypothetical protein L861_19500 [Litchfieldella anticariensis FP35 = DSM 16096]|uniref:DUF2291 domain-containing protein n=1 Tax=Litchfieldella anticariensis (strain DSM 16096 / CECT 5854 / CIP 108499 / LMG 22089 / FP35) TaxID=1121939 RepID=S2KMY4_LITA3|nr:DUF2291 domain-containing protein [Halomonas anticariensis]EPC01838.1 hypothetical protein L861_19500 [Halomonas anticariensis FP35 = DSM 16096]
MNASVNAGPIPRPRKGRGLATAIGIAFVLLGAMALDTTVVKIGSEADLRDEGFSAERFGAEHFPIVRDSVEERAVEASELAAAIAEDQTAAGERYGVPSGIAPVIPLSFSGVVGEGKAGIYTVNVEGVPDDLTIRVQTGPAINGTDLRDATGDIQFGQFTNQIEYQNAGAAINAEMKQQVLSDIDTGDLTGMAISVTGVFQLINPHNWLVTPVRLDVQ